MSMSDDNRPNPRSEADHVIYQVVLPIWDELYGHDFWGDGNFDAFYELPDELDEDNVRIGPAVSVAIFKGQIEIQYNEFDYFNLADPDCIYKAQQLLIKMFGNP